MFIDKFSMAWANWYKTKHILLTVVVVGLTKQLYIWLFEQLNCMVVVTIKFLFWWNKFSKYSNGATSAHKFKNVPLKEIVEINKFNCLCWTLNFHTSGHFSNINATILPVVINLNFIFELNKGNNWCVLKTWAAPLIFDI